MTLTFKKGFTLLETLLVLSLVVMMSTVVYASFSSLNDRQILDKEIAQVKSYIQKSRMDSMNSKNGDSHGVIFGSTTVSVIEVMATSTSLIYTLNNRVLLTSSTLASTTLTFARISGLPTATGTLTYVYKVGSKVIGTSTIIINGAGIVQ